MTQSCQNPRPKPGAPLALIVRYSDINVQPQNPAVRPRPGGVEVDLQQILLQNPPSGFGIIFSETTEQICLLRGEVSVPGANVGIRELVRVKAREHYQRFCECAPAAPPPHICEDFGIGGVNNLYRLTWTWRGVETRQEGNQCREFPFEQQASAFIWGPISNFRQTSEPSSVNFCGEAKAFMLYATVGSESNGCNPIEEVISTVIGNLRITASVDSIVSIVGRFPEVCPPVPCRLPPPLGLDPDPPPFIEEPDDPQLPPGEEAVTTIFVQGEPGKDGKNVQIGNINRFPAGQGISRAFLVEETETERVFALELEEELESQLIEVPTGACDIVTGEFTEEVVTAVLPILASTPGWGAVLAAIASMTFQVAKEQCGKDAPLIDRFGGEFITPVLPSREIVTIRVPQPADEFESFEVFIGISGAGQPLPTTLDIDTFDALGSEGVWGVAYLMGEFGVVEAAPHLLRFPVNYITGTWKRFRGIKLALPAGSQAGVNFNYKVKSE